MAHCVMRLGAVAVMIPTVERSGEISRSGSCNRGLRRRARRTDPARGRGYRSGGVRGGAHRRGWSDRCSARPVRTGVAARILRRRQTRVGRMQGHAADQRRLWRHALSGPAIGRRVAIRTGCSNCTTSTPMTSTSSRGAGCTRSMAASQHARVTSIHHQGVRRLGKDLIVDATSADGVIECIRRDASSWSVCNGTPNSTTPAFRRCYRPSH